MNEKMRVSLSELLPIIEEQLSQGKEVCFSPKGTSMLPLLVPERDSVILKSPPEKLKKYDLPLYRRENGQFVLHRVVKIAKDGSYIMCGDAQFSRESGIKQSQIVGIVTAFYIDGKLVKSGNILYKLYCICRVKERQIHRLYVKLRQRGAKIKKKMTKETKK